MQQKNLDLSYKIEIGQKKSRGIYLREAWEQQKQIYRVRITPEFQESATDKEQFQFERKLIFKSSADWVEVGKSMLLQSKGGTLYPTVDPAGLKPGAHFARIIALDAQHPKAGALFQIPVSVIKTESVENRSHSMEKKISLRPGSEQRFFINPPAEAALAKVTLFQEEHTNMPLTLHLSQIIPDRNYEQTSNRARLFLKQGISQASILQIDENRTLEICLAIPWYGKQIANCRCLIEFHGVVTPESATFLSATESGIGKITLMNELHPQQIQFQGELSTLQRGLHPVSSTIKKIY